VSMAPKKVDCDDVGSGNAQISAFGCSNSALQETDAESHLGQDVADEFVSVSDCFQHKRDLRWDESYNLLVEFKKKNGHCKVDRRKEKRLGDWVSRQRQRYKKGILSEYRREKLNAIGFNLEPMSVSWRDNCLRFAEFKKKNGHCRVSWKDEKNLALWSSKQRQLCRKGRMSEDRKEVLDAIGFVWEPQLNDKLQWQEKYLLLVEFKKKNGHCRVRQKTDRCLAKWVDRQRQLWRQGRIHEDRKEKLNSIGFEWESILNDKSWQWQENYLHLVEFKKKNGHCRVNKRTYKALGEWVEVQRVSYRRGSLSEDQIRKLNAIGFEWEEERCWQDISFLDHYLLLVESKNKNDHCRVKYKNNLRQWENSLREAYKRGTLSEDQIRRLNDIGFVWHPMQQKRSAKGKAPDYDRQQPDDNHLPRQQQTNAAVVVTGTLEQPLTPITPTPTPQDVTSQTLREKDDGYIDSNICEEFKDTVTYFYGDSEYWI